MIMDNNGIIKKSKDARDKYAEAKKNEIEMLGQIDIEELVGAEAKPGEIAKVNSKYKGAIIPKGFTVSGISSEQEPDTGLVIYDIPEETDVDWTDEDTVRATYNQFVWVPVPNIDEMAVKQTEYTYGEKYPDGYYVGVLDHYSYDREGIEPTIITGSYEDTYISDNYTGIIYDTLSENYSDILGFSSVKEFGEYVVDSYQQMVNSVKKYGGFYVARYETSLVADAAQSKKEKMPMISDNWYDMYLKQDSTRSTNNPYYNNTNVTTNMVWGSQWDAMIRWMSKNPEALVHINLYSVNEKNEKKFMKFAKHDDFEIGILPYETGDTDNQDGYDDRVNNVYDLEGNLFEATQETIQKKVETKNEIKTESARIIRRRRSNSEDLSFVMEMRTIHKKTSRSFNNRSLL